MNKFKLLSLASVSFVFIGCNAMRLAPKHPYAGYRDMKEYRSSWETVTIDANNKEVVTPVTVTSTNIPTIAWGRKRAIDIVYRDYISALSKEKKATNLTAKTLDLVLIGFGGVGVDAFKAKELEVFSQLQALTTGVNSHVNEELFYSQTIEILISKMNELRNAAWEITEARLEDTTNPQKILAAVDTYYEAGTLYTAFNYLSAQETTEDSAAKFLGGVSAAQNRKKYLNNKALELKAQKTALE